MNCIEIGYLDERGLTFNGGTSKLERTDFEILVKERDIRNGCNRWRIA